MIQLPDILAKPGRKSACRVGFLIILVLLLRFVYVCVCVCACLRACVRVCVMCVTAVWSARKYYLRHLCAHR